MKRKSLILALSTLAASILRPVTALASDLPAKSTDSPESIFSIIWNTLVSIIKNNWLFILLFLILLIFYLRHKHYEDPRNQDDK